MYTFGENLYALRKEQRITQEELATLLDVSRQTISNWENGTAQPTIDKVILLAKTYGISIDTLVGNTTQAIKKENPSPLLKALIGKRVIIYFGSSSTHPFFPENSIKNTEIVHIMPTYIKVKVYKKEVIEQIIAMQDILAVEEEEL